MWDKEACETMLYKYIILVYVAKTQYLAMTSVKLYKRIITNTCIIITKIYLQSFIFQNRQISKTANVDGKVNEKAQFCFV